MLHNSFSHPSLELDLPLVKVMFSQVFVCSWGVCLFPWCISGHMTRRGCLVRGVSGEGGVWSEGKCVSGRGGGQTDPPPLPPGEDTTDTVNRRLVRIIPEYILVGLSSVSMAVAETYTTDTDRCEIVYMSGTLGVLSLVSVTDPFWPLGKWVSSASRISSATLNSILTSV